MAEGGGRDPVAALQRLMEITASLNSTLNVDELLGLIINSAADLLGAETASLLLVDEETGELIVQVATGEPGEEAMRQRVPAGQGIAGWVVEQGEPVIVDDPSSDSRFYEGMDQAIGFETRNLVAVPLKVRDRVIGVVEVINKQGDDGFDQSDADLAGALSNQAAIAIDNARLYAKLADAVVTSRMSYRL
jgi:phosphoserine phosphatase RsbU/P